MPLRIRSSLPLLSIAVFVLGACHAETDRRRYASGDPGVTSFHNGIASPVYLEGCSAYRFERRDPRGDWIDAGPAVVCFWEGFAQPVPGNDSLDLGLQAPAQPGEYRLRYDVGLGCDPEQPLSEEACTGIRAVHTPPFEVAAQCDPAACGPQLGMPNWLCADGVNLGGPTGRCLGTPDADRCGWEIASCPDDQ